MLGFFNSVLAISAIVLPYAEETLRTLALRTVTWDTILNNPTNAVYIVRSRRYFLTTFYDFAFLRKRKHMEHWNHEEGRAQVLAKAA